MAAKKRATKKTKKKSAKKTKKAKLHHVKVGNGKPAPGSLVVKHGDTVSFTKTDKADRFAQFSSSPFRADQGAQTYKIPFKRKVNAKPPHQKSYHYIVVGKDRVAGKGPPNPPEIVVG